MAIQKINIYICNLNFKKNIMKKTLILGIIALVVFACKSTSATNTKIDNKSEVAMKGSWTITSVKFAGSDYIKVNALQIADSKCFEGSKWKLISNNNKGEMALTKSGCTQFASTLTWFVNKDGQFVLKLLQAGEKAKRVRDGYVFNVANQSETSFQLIDKADIGGKMTDVIYQFEKDNQ